MGIIEELFNTIAPHICLGCSREGSLICYECSQSLQTTLPRCYRCGRLNNDFQTCPACRKRTSIHSLWSTAQYDGVAKELVQRLKFGRAKAAAGSLAELLAARLPLDQLQDAIVVYVPTANDRVRQRGYDQAALIAKELSRRLGLPFSPCLSRQGNKRQVGSSRRERTAQMEGAFRAVRQHALLNKHVLLVDDVLTTGATCEAAARVLRQAGAKRVSAAVFAVA